MSEYKVVSNWCNCHPETCCCSDYAIVNEQGEKITTVYSEAEGNTYIIGLIAIKKENKKLNKQLKKLKKDI